MIHFVDNTGALSSLVHGYAGKAEAARLVNMFHLALIALDIKWYGEWVPSKANVADIMTRETRFHELESGISAIFGRDAFLTMTSAELELKSSPR